MSQHATHPAASGNNNARSAKDDAMSAQTGELLSLRGVHAHYGKSHILHGIDRPSAEAKSSACWAATAPAAPPP